MTKTIKEGGFYLEERMVESRKNLKRNKILSTIRYAQEISRHDVKKITEYSMTTVLNVINELVEKQFLIEEEEVSSTRIGRKPTWLHINPNGQFFIGVEFNANGINCVVVNFSFKVIYSNEDKVTQDMSVQCIIEKIKQSITRALEFLGEERNRVLGIGIGLPGYINRSKGIGVEYAHIDNWKNVDIKNVIEKEFGYEVLIENNTNTMAIAYRWQKYGETSDDFVLVSMRYGTRMGMIINNNLFVGNGGNAGEIGHMKLLNGSRFCSCGKIGCVDTEVSFIAIKSKIIERMLYGYFKDIKEIINGNMENITMDMFVDSALSGSKDSIKLLEETAIYLGQCLTPVIATLNPKRIIIASESGFGGEMFSNKVYEVIKENVTPILLEDFDVKCIKVERNIGAFGAAMLVVQKEYTTVEPNSQKDTLD
jgi:N-acetylglucosamine repressor